MLQCEAAAASTGCRGCNALPAHAAAHAARPYCAQVFAKAGLISTKEDKHGGDTILTAVNRSHELYTQHRPYKTAASATAAAAGAPAAAGGGGGMAAGAAAGGGAGGGGPAPSSSSCDPLVVEEVYKPTRETKRAPTPAGTAARLVLHAFALHAMA